MKEIKWNTFNRAELVSFLEGFVFVIGVTEKRAYYLEHIKEEIGFTKEDSLGNYYNQISKSSFNIILLYVQKFSESHLAIVKEYLLELLSCDPESPITKIGLSNIFKISNQLKQEKI